MIQFITINELKKRGFIHGNVDTDTLKICISRAQDMNIQEALGTPLYKKMIELVDDWLTNQTAIPAVYKELLEDKLQPALVAWTDERASVHLLYRITNKTVGQNEDQYIRASERKAAISLKDRLTKDAEFYTERLIGYLIDNCEDFPEYKDYICKRENVARAKSGYSKPFY